MPHLPFVTVDVFTQTRFSGNPLAVAIIPAGQEVTQDQRQSIAREFNLSETVFLSSIQGSEERPEWRMFIHMTDRELPFAGHPTIGGACYALGTLAKGARSGRLMCPAGPINVEYEGGVATASIPHHFHLHTESTFTLALLYGLQPSLKAAAEPKAVDVVSPVKGMNFICAELADLESLASVKTSGTTPNAKLDQGWDVGFQGLYLYVLQQAPQQDDTTVSVRTRMIEGALEDPATGSAACGLSMLLALKHRKRRLHVQIVQGVEMGRRSDIGVVVTLKDDLNTVERVDLSGSAIKVMEGTLEY